MSIVEHTRMSSSSSCDESPPATTTTTTTTQKTEKSKTNSNKSPTNKAVEGDGVCRFAGPGVDFKGKLIGVEDVTESRGDKMCQVAMAKLKAAVKAAGEHKKKIVINVSLDGVKICDEKSTEILHTHQVHRISFIARDTSDTRAFGYIYRPNDGSYQFFGIKTEKTAESLVLSLRDLFQAVFDLKKKTSEAENGSASENSGAEKSPTEDCEKANSDNKKITAEQKTELETSTQPSAEENLLNLDADVPDFSKPKLSPGFGSPSIWTSADPWNASTGAVPVRIANLGPTAMFYPAPAVAMVTQSPAFPAQVLPQSTSPFVISPFHPSPPTATAYSIPPVPTVSPVPPVPGSLIPPTHVWSTPSPAAPIASIGVYPLGSAQPQPWPSSFLSGSTSGSPAMSSDPFVVSTTVAVHGAGSSARQSGSVGGGQSLGTPLIPARIGSPVSVSSSPGNPFTSPVNPSVPNGSGGKTSAGRSDPFADLALLSAPLPPPGKKTEKRDFFAEPPKPSLLDLTEQRKQQQIAGDLDIFGAKPFSTVMPSNDPFA